MKLFYLLGVSTSILFLYRSSEAQTLPNTDPNTIPTGLSYEDGPGASGGWTYNYGTKLTLWLGAHRNFEIMSTDKLASSTLAFRTYNGSSWTAWRELVYMKNGKVGIGTNTPSKTLHVLGTGTNDGLITAESTGTNPAVSVNTVNSFGGTTFFTSGASNNFIDGSAPGDGGIRFTNGKKFVLGANQATYFTVLNNGNVGIGTLNPDSRLTVNGKIKAEEIQVVVDVPADYVFEENYTLQPLEEVEAYIKANKHLPGIPSADEIKEQGWQLGEMNNKLLEKVEELTLHLIEIKKTVLNQQKKMADQDAIIQYQQEQIVQLKSEIK